MASEQSGHARIHAKLLGVPLDEVLYIIAHPETPAPHKDDFTPEFIEPLI